MYNRNVQSLFDSYLLKKKIIIKYTVIIHSKAQHSYSDAELSMSTYALLPFDIVRKVVYLILVCAACIR